MKSKETLRHNYMDPAVEAVLVEMTIPDKPTSRNQRYRKREDNRQDYTQERQKPPWSMREAPRRFRYGFFRFGKRGIDGGQ